MLPWQKQLGKIGFIPASSSMNSSSWWDGNGGNRSWKPLVIRDPHLGNTEGWMQTCCPVPLLQFYTSGKWCRPWWVGLPTSLTYSRQPLTRALKVHHFQGSFWKLNCHQCHTEMGTSIVNEITVWFSYKPEPGSILIKVISFELLWGRGEHALHARLCKVSHLHCRTL